MSQNFYALLETRELNSLLVPEVVWEACNDLMKLIDTEEDMNKLYEYTELLRDKKLKKSLEIEISEALTPLLEKNTILYGSFLYDTMPLQESCCENARDTLSYLRELLGSDFIAEALSPERAGMLKKAGKIAAGVGAAGLAGAGGLYALGRGQDGVEGIVDTVKAGAGRVGNYASETGGRVKNYLVNAAPTAEDGQPAPGIYDRSIGRLTTAGKIGAGGVGAAGAGLGAYGLYRRHQKRRA